MSLRAEISKKLEYIQSTISNFEKLVEDVDDKFPHPLLIERGKNNVFRHRPEDKSDTLASYLKLVRIVSLLNSCIHLIQKGHVQEVYILCRAIDEAEDDITFFALPLGETGTDNNQMRLLNEFFQEEHDDPENPLSNTKRDRVPRKKIWAASSSLPEGVADPNAFMAIAKSIYQTFSGYVHGTYASIMEMYHPVQKKYQMRGMLDSYRTLECIDNLPNHIYRSVSALETLCYRIQSPDVAKSALKLNIDLAKKTGCLDEEGIESMERRLNSDFLKDTS